ncbi:MAG: hypothetical protein CMJ40_09415 [Phycisphaerae bacterium]|nr:hypothetical protein [Phycisphaerae bacterium]
MTRNVTYLKWLILMGIVEGISTLWLLFGAMPLKYWFDLPQHVTIAGNIHGFLFLGLVAMFIVGKWVVPLSGWMVFFGIIGAIFPFGPFIVDLKLYKYIQESR